MRFTVSAALSAALLLGAFSAPVVAQSCPGDNFWKNDILADVPGGAVPTAVIQGMCEGEAAAQVFYLDPGQQRQKINKVSVGFGHVTGSGGFNATVNVEIYDGITWNGNTPILGPKVFDLNDDTASSMQVLTHGLNELDLSNFDIIVGDGTNAFVVAFRMNINPNGTCGGGHPANFLTDASSTASCTTVPQTSLMFITGEGWVEPRTFLFGGIIALCPNFYNGNFLIRACTEDAGGTGEFIDLGNQLTGFFAPTLSGSGSLAGGESFTLTFAGMPLSTTAFAFFDLTAINAPFKGGILVPAPTFKVMFPTPAFAFQTVDINSSIPIGLPSGLSIYLQAWFPDAGGVSGASATNALEAALP